MKQIFFVLIIGFSLFSCAKPNNQCSSQASLDGKWRMVYVKENVSGSTLTKPATTQGEVDILFISTSSTGGTFTGYTPTNEIFQSDFYVAVGQALTIANLAMTKVAETSWGNEFVENIRDARSYSFDNAGQLNIKTVNKTLSFRKQ
jgi:hypothetical protein